MPYPNKLSWLLNENIGIFFSLQIHNFRLVIFPQKALDASNRHFTFYSILKNASGHNKRLYEIQKFRLNGKYQ